MSADHLQFLRNKFISDFQEASMEFGEFLPFSLHFQNFLETLRKTRISSSTPIRLKDSLYDLKYALADCISYAEKVRDLQLTQKRRTSLMAHFVKTLYFRYRTKRKLFQIEKKLLPTVATHDDTTVANNYSTCRNPVTARLPQEFPRFEASKIYGFNDYFQKTKALLLETPYIEGIKMIGIVGMGGSGKTTLAQMLFHCPSVQEMFSPMIWVRLDPKHKPKDVDFRGRIVEAILGCSQSDFYWKYLLYDRVNAVQALHLSLLNKRYLIVLDNVWHDSDWYSDLGSEFVSGDPEIFTRLAHGLPKGNGGAVIITSRLERVVTRMVGKQNLIHIKPIADPDSRWSIFMDTVREKSFLNTNCYSSLLAMKDDIVHQCDGLPLAIKTLAEILSVQIADKQNWSDRKFYKGTVFRLDLHDEESMRKACDIISGLPGVDYIEGALGRMFIYSELEEIRLKEKVSGIRCEVCNNTLKVAGEYDLLDMLRVLEKYWRTELISVGLGVESSKRVSLYS